jgi:hypothetical protein
MKKFLILFVMLLYGFYLYKHVLYIIVHSKGLGMKNYENDINKLKKMPILKKQNT